MIGQSVAILSVIGLPIAAALFLAAFRSVARPNGGKLRASSPVLS